MLDLLGYPENKFSHAAAQLIKIGCMLSEVLFQRTKNWDIKVCDHIKSKSLLLGVVQDRFSL